MKRELFILKGQVLNIKNMTENLEKAVQNEDWVSTEIFLDFLERYTSYLEDSINWMRDDLPNNTSEAGTDRIRD